MTPRSDRTMWCSDRKLIGCSGCSGSTSRDECIPAFSREVKAGLSYRQFLTVLFLAAIENGDPHQVAQVYGAHRISSEARIEERLLPLFWALNRLKQESELGAAKESSLTPFKGQLPGADRGRRDISASRCSSPTRPKQNEQPWPWPATTGRDTSCIGSGNLHRGTLAGISATRRLLSPTACERSEVMGWQHSEVALRYVTRYIGGYSGDNTYAPNLATGETDALPAPGGLDQRRRATRPRPWNSTAFCAPATQTDSCDLICSQLLSEKVKAGSVWDAISLAAADSVFRHKTGGGHDWRPDSRRHDDQRAAVWIQSESMTRTRSCSICSRPPELSADFYVRHVGKEGNLRDMNLLDLKTAGGNDRGHDSRCVRVVAVQSEGSF